MTFKINYTATGNRTFQSLERVERNFVEQKLTQIATNEFRNPREWDFEQLPGPAEGRLGLSDGLRALVDIEDESRLIRVHKVGRRENLYS